MSDSHACGSTARLSRLALPACLLLFLLPLPSVALGSADITPLYFDGVGGQGFAPASVSAQGLAPGFQATPSNLWLSAGAVGSGSAIEISQVLGTVYQNPSQPSFSNPLIADSTWTVRNQSGSALKAPLLVFTSVDPAGVYPITLPPTGLDADLLSILSYSYSGGTLLYGVARLPDLAAGASAEITVRYAVAGALASGNPRPLPPLGVAGLGSYQIVPEPATGALLAAGVLWLAASRPRRR